MRHIPTVRTARAPGAGSHRGSEAASCGGKKERRTRRDTSCSSPPHKRCDRLRGAQQTTGGAPPHEQNPTRGSARPHGPLSPSPPRRSLTWSGAARRGSRAAVPADSRSSPSHSSQSPPRSAAAAFNPPRGRLSPPAGGAGVPVGRWRRSGPGGQV